VAGILKSVSSAEEKSRILNDINTQFTNDFIRDYDLTNDFSKPILNVTDEIVQKIIKLESKLDDTTKLFPGGLYQRKMRKASRIIDSLPIKETFRGSRIAVINAVGGIASGKSSNSGLNGRTLGSDTVIEMMRRVKNDPGIKGVVLRIDSPGTHLWRCITHLLTSSLNCRRIGACK